MNDLSLERRNGYAWYSNGEQKTIDDYAAWAKATLSFCSRQIANPHASALVRSKPSTLRLAGFPQRQLATTSMIGN